VHRDDNELEKAVQLMADAKELMSEAEKLEEKAEKLMAEEQQLTADKKAATWTPPSFVEWLHGATEATCDVVEAQGDPREMPWHSPVLMIRQCYRKFEQDIVAKWNGDTPITCVFSGTPGIGKTAMLYYLLWRFLKGELKNYDGIVFGDAVDLIFIQMGEHGPKVSRFNQDLGYVATGKCLGLIDVSPDGKIYEGKMTMNVQRARESLRVRHLLIAATPGWSLQLGQLEKSVGPRYFLPAWKRDCFQRLCTLHGMTEAEINESALLCGECVPRLVLHYYRGQIFDRKERLLQSTENGECRWTSRICQRCPQHARVATQLRALRG